MLTRATWLAVIGVSLVVGPRVFGAARQCVMFPETDELFRVNDTVFTGTVLSNMPVPGPEDGVQNIGTLRGDRFWKGTPRREIRVGSDLPFLVGESYVVFASGEPLSTTIACEATQLMAKAMTKRLWLSRQPSRTADQPPRVMPRPLARHTNPEPRIENHGVQVAIVSTSFDLANDLVGAGVHVRTRLGDQWRSSALHGATE